MRILIGWPTGSSRAPADDEFLGLAIEISLTKREGVERMKELRDFVDAKLNHFARVYRLHISSEHCGK